ncbi:Hypothetical protein CINCED_3A008253 [Cinara cedri]|uniref:Prothoracicostatic peptide n=1 Tax=Cinara cedri TaxID=506608 RepID=A0A5E4N4N2_9HEMI|nr:Hypothetical protein CINCED_3A008253 [Cinara cedri]
MQNVLGRIATTLVILYPVIAFSIPESAIQTSSLKSSNTEQDNADYTRTFDEEQEEKRALRDLQMAGTGKRGWQNLKTTWGKRAQDWQNLHSSWGKRQGWQKLHGGWGKRGWKDMQSGGWGKRAKDMANGQWSQYNDNADKYENEIPTVLADKRSWDNFQGSWGKRAADWTSFRGKPVRGGKEVQWTT